MVIALVLLLAIFIANGCQQLPSGQQSTSPQSEAATLALTDALGREVTLQKVPQKIVVVGKALFTIVNAMYLFPEAPKRIFAMGDLGQISKAEFYALVDPTYKEKVKLGTEVNAEQVAALQPDVVLMKSYLAESLGKPIEQLGIPVVYLDLESPDVYSKDIYNLGILLNDTKHAEKVNHFYKSKLELVRNQVKNVQDKPTALVLYYNEKDGNIAFNVPPLNWIQTVMIDNAAAVPVWKDANLGKGWTKVSFEQIAAWNPEYIFVVAYFNDIDKVLEQLKADSRWQALSAYKDGHMYGFPIDFVSWDQADTRWILGQMWVAKTIHPDLFKDIDLTNEVTEFYNLYGLSEETIKTKILPLIKGSFH
jgi:iron complex transport system substrate-binding protein